LTTISTTRGRLAVNAGFLALGQPSPSGPQQVCVTRTGQSRYAELCTAQHPRGAALCVTNAEGSLM
ncbi:MAG: hypothetical protein LC808_22145, partial [Actinobacteria bacterium]|nr:hypothetical protein [Actinomycetota bacterium]